ncbi:hypothetical protein ACYOEI_12970 [Singulisphaera rosea]
MANSTILVCPCGMRLKAAGAVPGRVGKCPKCGGMLRVPETTPPQTPPASEDSDGPAGYVVEARTSTYDAKRGLVLPDRPTAKPSKPIRDGLILPPSKNETQLRVSLLYPLWGTTGLAILIFFPPILWFATIPFIGFFTPAQGNPAVRAFGFVSVLPAILILLPTLSFILTVLGQVLVASAQGEVHHPRWPEWDPTEMFRGLWRWVWAFIIGGTIGGIPAVAYWMYCGDIDLVDQIIFIELIALGAVYAQMALLASILHDDPLGANPITVLRAIRRVGWCCVRPSLVIGFALMLTAMGIVGLLQITNPPLSAVAYWAFWVAVLYESMVVLRVLGLFYHRNARVLGWFRDRPRWGV